MHGLSEHHILLFLIQVLILLGLARGLGELLRRVGQPSLIGDLLVGIVLGPTILGRAAPGLHAMLFPADPTQIVMLETVAWLGLFFFLLETGLELDFSSAWRQRGDALTIAFSDVLLPMLIAFVPCLFFPQRLIGDAGGRVSFALFMAAIMTISAMPATARVLQDLNLYKTNVGFLIMSALSVNDLIGWVIFTLILGFVTQAEVRLVGVALTAVGTIGFSAFCLTAGRWFADKSMATMRRLAMPEPGSSLTFIALLGLLCGAITTAIGIHALFGFFLAGIMAGEARSLSERTRQVISQMVHAIFIPLFFAGIGLQLDLLANFNPLLVLVLFVLGTAGRYLGAWVGVTLTDQPRANRDVIAIAHVPGGEMQIVVSMLAVEYGLLTREVFVAVVVGAVASTAVLGAWMGAALKRRKAVDLLEFFARDLVLDLKSATPEEAVRELCEAVAVARTVPPSETLFEAVMKRERDFGTAIDHGIAVPHARLDGVRSPMIVFGRSADGIDWNSPDGQATSLVFLLLTPRDDSVVQLRALGTISRALRDPAARQKLARAEAGQGVWEALTEVMAGKQPAMRPAPLPDLPG